MTIRHLTAAELDEGLDEIRSSPKDNGVLQMIVRRPRVGSREVLTEAALDVLEGLAGDTWQSRSSSRSADGRAHPDMQINIMNARVIALIAQDPARWPLAGDQLYVDFDLSEDNVPPGTRLSIGGSVIEITAQPHTGCQKFVERFGADAATWVNSPVGRSLHLRGVNAKVVHGGPIHVGDGLRKL